MRENCWSTIAALGICLIGLAAVLVPVTTRSEPPLDVHLLVNSTAGIKDNYVYRLLDLALASQDRPYTLTAEAVQASQLRRVETVRASARPYVINLGSSQENEQMLWPIYVPVFLGLDLSQRIMLTRKGLEAELKTVGNLEDLKRFVFGQGLGWTDVAILEKVGLKVFTPPSKPALMRMLDAGHIDVFPRGLFEVIPDFEAYTKALPDIVIDEYLVLTYPLASFFFVNKEHAELHKAIETGLRRVYASGKMQDMLIADPSHSRAIKEIRLDKRTRIAIPMFGATEATRTALKRYPFIPGKPPGAPAR